MNEIIAYVKRVFLEKYVCFTGRANRKEFWYSFLFVAVVNIILSLIFGRTGKVGMIIQIVWSLAVLLPTLGVGARRLHDINKSGWLMLIGLIPVVGEIILIIWWAKAGDPQQNQYGSVPEEIQA